MKLVVKIIGFLVVALLFSSCKNNQPKTMKPETEEQSLKSVLEKKQLKFIEKASDETKKIYGEGIIQVKLSGITETAKQVGDVAPNFELKNAVGETVSLQSYLKKGPVVLTWYRGGWCPYCNLTLQYLQRELPNFKLNGANLIALTPELPDNSMNTVEKNKLEFEVLSLSLIHI